MEVVLAVVLAVKGISLYFLAILLEKYSNLIGAVNGVWESPIAKDKTSDFTH